LKSQRIGVLALQGDFAAHAGSLRALGHEPFEVRRTHQLEQLAGLVIPGGESTTLLNLMQDEPWFDALRRFHGRGGAILGTCAGAILLARKVLNPPQDSLGLLDVVIRRNAFGRQVDSFEANVALSGSNSPLRASFIRAPRLCELGDDVEVLGTLGDESAQPVLVRQGRVIAATFHTELASDHRLHSLFVKLSLKSNPTDERESRQTAAESPPPSVVARERRMSW
jgi:5'-phosphate synthase pdxT subunit